MLETLPAELDDFSGGITDFIIDGNPSSYQHADNLLITPNRKLRSVYGSEIYNIETPQPFGNVRIRDIITAQETVSGEDRLLVQAQNKLIESKGEAWEEILSPDGLSLFPEEMEDKDKISYSYWNGHLLFTNSKFKPVKVFFDEAHNLKGVTAGLPRMAAPTYITAMTYDGNADKNTDPGFDMATLEDSGWEVQGFSGGTASIVNGKARFKMGSDANSSARIRKDIQTTIGATYTVTFVAATKERGDYSVYQREPSSGWKDPTTGEYFTRHVSGQTRWFWKGADGALYSDTGYLGYNNYSDTTFNLRGWTYLKGPVVNSYYNSIARERTDEYQGTINALTFKVKSHAGTGDLLAQNTVTEANGVKTATFEATSATTQIEFETSGQHGYWEIDDVQVTEEVGGYEGQSSYLYAFHYLYEYNVGDVQFADYGPVTYMRAENSAVMDWPGAPAWGRTLTEIPEVKNVGANQEDNGDRYDVGNIYIKIFRTQADGDNLQLLTTVPNGTHTYLDNTPDADIRNNETLYTEGGVLENDPPPVSKFVHIANGAAFYANVKDRDGNALGYRILQSVVGDPDSVPAGNYIDLEEPITGGITSIGDRVIAFSRKSTFRIDGLYDELGMGGLARERISSTLGCISAKSIVQVPGGVVFADESGFCFTDGFDVFRINDSFYERFKDLVVTEEQRRNISGTYDKETKRVYWSVQVGSDNDMVYILDLNYGIKPHSVFTTMSGGSQRPGDFAPTALTFINNELIRGDTRGYIFRHNETLKNNPIVETFKPVSEWGTSPILYNWVSIATSFGNKKLRKFTPKMLISLENQSNISVQITSISDLKKKTNVKPIRFRGNFTWGDPMFTWGNESFRWGSAGFIEQQRHFHSNDLRCSYRQLQLTNAFTTVANSDGITEANGTKINRTLTLPEGFKWPTDLLTYSIAFEGDGYEKLYPIESRESDSSIVVQDSGGDMPDGETKWIMKGYMKGEILSLLNVTVMYAFLGQTQARFNPSSEGGNE